MNNPTQNNAQVGDVLSEAISDIEQSMSRLRTILTGDCDERLLVIFSELIKSRNALIALMEAQ